MKCTYNTTLWHVYVTTVTLEMKQCLLYIVEIHVTANNTTISSFEQKFFYGKCMSPSTMKRTYIST